MAVATKSTVFGTAADKPNYFIFEAAGGYLWWLNRFYLQPELRVGLIVNSRPGIIIGDGLLFAGYAF